MEKLWGAESPADGWAAGGWMLLSLSRKLPGCTLWLRPGYIELETGWASSKIPHHPPLSSPCSTLPSPSHAAHHLTCCPFVSACIYSSAGKKIKKHTKTHTHTLPGFLSAKQDFPIRFSALISCYRPLVTCLICSCPDKIISPSWIWPRFVPALCLFPRLPAGLPLRLCGSSQTGLLSFTLSCASPPTLSKWTNRAVPCLWRVVGFRSSRTSL